jgi:hypothetical protein
MGGLRASEIDRRIEQDDGDPTARVWICPTVTASVYHAEEDCSGFRNDGERTACERATAQRKRYAPCAVCVLEGTPDAAPHPATIPRQPGPAERIASLTEQRDEE